MRSKSSSRQLTAVEVEEGQGSALALRRDLLPEKGSRVSQGLFSDRLCEEGACECTRGRGPGARTAARRLSRRKRGMLQL